MSLQYTTSYSVSVKYTFNNNDGLGVQEAGYGSECTITTPSIPTVGLASPICGTQLSYMGTTISSYPATGVVRYRFRRRLVGGVTYNETLPLTSRFSSLSAMNQGSVALTYDASYLVSVQFSVMLNGVETWSAYGTECLILTAFAPTTELQASQCGTGATAELPELPYAAPSLTTPIYAVAVTSGATYTFQLQRLVGIDLVGPVLEVNRTQNWFSLNMVSGIVSSGVYQVTVITRSQYGDGYGKDCVIKAPALSRENATDTMVKVTFNAAAYPNPFANNFVIDVKTRSESAVSLKVYDMIGRLVDQKEVKVSDLETTPIGDNYPSGVYNIVVTQDNDVKTVRVVKR